MLSPPTRWFHQHFNTGTVRARQLALRYGGHNYGVEFHDTQSRAGEMVSIRQGGTLVEYGDEDPAIRAIYQRELSANRDEDEPRDAAATSGMMAAG